MADDGDLMAVIEEDQLNSKDLLFLANETKMYQFKVNPTVQDMGKSLQVLQWISGAVCTEPSSLFFPYQIC